MFMSQPSESASDQSLPDSSASTLECGICMEEFNDRDKYPMVFPCGHTLCNACIANLNPKSECVFCRKRGVPVKNFVVLDAVEKLKAREEKQAKEKKSKASSCQVCEKKAAEVFCPQCSVDFCGACDSTHHAMGVFKIHKRVNAREKELFKEEMCSVHANQRVSHYCKTCQKTICSTCKEAKRFCADHNPASVVDVRQELMEEARKKKRDVENEMKAHLENIVHSMAAASAVREWTSSLKAMVDRMEARALRDIKSYGEQLKPILKSYCAQAAFIESYVAEASRIIKSLDQPEMQNVSDSYAATMIQKAIDLLNQSNQLIKDMESDEDAYMSVKFDLTDVDSRLQALKAALVLPPEAFGQRISRRFDSLIVSQSPHPQWMVVQIRQLMENDRLFKFQLLWRGSRDGFSSSAFHSRCDNKGPTIALIKNTNNYVFGAFAAESWTSGGAYRNVGGKSFLFSFLGPEQMQKQTTPVKLICQPYDGNELYDNSGYGPTFGGGHDLHITHECGSNHGSYCNPSTFNAVSPKFNQVSLSQSTLAGSHSSWRVIEIEVFQVIES